MATKRHRVGKSGNKFRTAALRRLAARRVSSAAQAAGVDIGTLSYLHVAGDQASVVRNLNKADHALSQAQGSIGLLLNEEDRSIAPERTAFLHDLWETLEKNRRVLSRRAWKSGRRDR